MAALYKLYIWLVLSTNKDKHKHNLEKYLIGIQSYTKRLAERDI